MFQKIMYVVTTQFEIHPRYQERKYTSSQPGTVHHVLTVALVFFESQHQR